MIVASILTIMLLTSVPFVFLSSIQTESQKDNDEDNGDSDSSYPDICISSSLSDLNCDDVPNKKFKVSPPDPMDLTVMNMV